MSLVVPQNILIPLFFIPELRLKEEETEDEQNMFKSYFTPHMLRSNSYRLTVDFIGITGQGDMEALLSCAGDKVIKGNKKFTANFSVQLSRLKADKTVFLPRCIDLDFNGNLNYLNFCRQS